MQYFIITKCLLMYRIIDDKVKCLMSKPLGILINEKPPKSINLVKIIHKLLSLKYLVSIGDVITHNLIKYWKIPNMAIIDYRSAREKYEYELSGFDFVLNITNPRSTLSIEGESCVARCFSTCVKDFKVLLVVDGEEDLLAIPTILNAPSKTLILYGLRNNLLAIPVVIEYKLAALKLYTLMSRVL